MGAVDLSNGATIAEGKNDTFIVDVDGETKTIIIPPGSYSADDLLKALNDQLTAANAGLIASYYNGKLKLTTEDVGQIPIDGIRGNARETLFYKTESRVYDPDYTYQVGANSGESLTVDKTRVSDKLLRINTVMVETTKSSQKALSRLDAALDSVLTERGKTGAIENRLDSIINGNKQYEENLVSAESRIRDADIAKEVLDKVKSDILDQVSQAMVVQANTSAKSVLDLLK